MHPMSRNQGPRRPLVLPPESREILASIRDSLNKRTDQTVQAPPRARDSPDVVSQARRDSLSSGSSGTPSLSKPPSQGATGSAQNKKKYTDNALRSIREALKPYKTQDSGNSSLESSQDGSYAEINRSVLQQLGLTEVNIIFRHTQ